ncbi:MAG TPA: Xaa-Pro peptidase family protein [Candidatus Eisenbacteria bacterium]|nr:Xaa-Pro peptidase family protein [Candidatus Eisenbacteria bacterium]
MSTVTGTQAGSLGARKLAQAQALLPLHGLDLWLIAVRESSDRPEPVLPFFFDLDFTWTSLFLVGTSRSAALVATFDAPDLERLGLFDEVVTYKEGPRESLLRLLDSFAPKSIGIDVSADDALADGLTAGLRDWLGATLAGSSHETSLVSAAPFLAHWRSVKLAEEVERIVRAIDETEAMFDRVRDSLRIGQTAREVAAAFHDEATRAGVATAWPRGHCPTVAIGGRSPIGHVRPGEDAIEPGSLVHVDFGIVRNGYRSDLQRVWYVAGESGEAPAPVKAAYAAVVEAIARSAAALKPGAVGWEVDAVARGHLASLGYPEYAHALGHHLGRAVHDGGGTLGPRWERYGITPFEKVREGSVYTLEPSLFLEGQGLVSLEEDVVVEADGARFLSRFPRELPILRLP